MHFSVRNLSLFFFLILIAFPAAAQVVKEVSSEVKAVTVFLNRAQVSAEAKTNLPMGTSEIALTNIPAALDQNSIQVQGQGNFTLLSVRFDYDYLRQNTKPRELRQAEDSLTYYQNQVRTLNDQIDIYKKEEGMVLSNQSIGGQKGVVVEDLEDAADFFRNRLFAIRANILKNENRLKRLNEHVARFTNLVNNFNYKDNRSNGRILVTVSSDIPTQAQFKISYVVLNAGWQPAYDLRATNTKNPVTFFYKANVFQNTGVNWKNVQLTLATTNPSIGATKPQLQPWYLDFYAMPKRKLFSRKDATTLSMQADKAAPVVAEEEVALASAQTTADYVQVSESALAVNFELKIPYSVPADGKMQLVEIQQYEVPSTFIYTAVPKLAPEAFLTAQLTGWDELNILPGEANVFLEGTFTGKTFLNPQVTGDTLQVSLGRDKRVVLTREKVKEFKSKSFLGGNRKETRGFLISARNTRDQAIELTLEDQIPVSNNSQIEVELLDDGGGKLDKNTGKVTWQLKLNPNETKKVPLKFSVKYPKNEQVPGL
ncbi:DUF4139 domain-containing protein [Adhaeribacter soli]|uniref:DUF4139 domain-containing protein n=1 Tax=Adhaeribacter soli TaxID=2607655 RepID=A0A5N1IVE4_9BACT|nr:DUF4139 domain-containing protein [Adhaeribacter soli]KAA9333738.1 DUF4139 domain-containing protein [Adhaeribacter soli]